MSVDIYSTEALVAVVESLKRPVTFLLDTFFPFVINSDKEQILFDVEVGKRRIAPLVHPSVEGQIVESLGFETNLFTPAYVKDKRVFDTERPMKRRIGENISGTLTPDQRVQLQLAADLEDMMGMLARRKEVWASEAIRTGAITIEGKGYGTVVVSFNRAAAHTIALAGGSRWGETGVEPIKDIEAWKKLMLQTEGAVGTDFVMDSEAWGYVQDDPRFDKAIDIRRPVNQDTASIVRGVIEGGEYVGRLGNTNLWTYEGWYEDVATGVETQIWPANSCALVSRNRVEGRQHNGAIRDHTVGFRPGEMVPKSWVDEDPSARYLMGQAAPLIVPFRPNATLGVTVR